MKLFNLEIDSTVFNSGVFLTKFGHKFLIFLSAQYDYMCESVKKNNLLGRSALCIKVSSDPIFDNGDFFSDFRVQKFPLIFFDLNPF